MARRFRTARFLKWVATLECVVILAIAVVTARTSHELWAPGGIGVALGYGAAVFVHSETATTWRWEVARGRGWTDAAACWRQVGRPRACEGPLVGKIYIIPLWLPLFAFAAVAVWAWRYDRNRWPPGHCQECGYDLTGNVSGVCPECGGKIRREGKTE